MVAEEGRAQAPCNDRKAGDPEFSRGLGTTATLALFGVGVGRRPAAAAAPQDSPTLGPSSCLDPGRGLHRVALERQAGAQGAQPWNDEEPRWKLATFIKYSFTRLPPPPRAGKKIIIKIELKNQTTKQIKPNP